MYKFRQFLLGFVAGGIVLYTWALIAMEVLVPSLVPITCLIVSVILLVGLVGAFIWTARQTIRQRDSIWWAIGTAVSGFAAFMVTAIVLDWGPGANIRALPGLAFLPDGNLLIAGGRAGWTYLALITLLVVALVPWSKVKTMLDSKKSDSSVKQPKVKTSQTEIVPAHEFFGAQQ